MNGRKSHKFEIGSRVLAQGCPLSPLLFLFIGEPLTRLVLEERELKGVKIGEHEHKVGQFADDTAAMLEGYEQLEKPFEIINKWEKATGMACNKAKTAIIPMGATRRKEVPETLLRELKLPNPSEEPWLKLGSGVGWSEPERWIVPTRWSLGAKERP